MSALTPLKQVQEITLQFYRDYEEIANAVLPEEVFRTKMAALRALRTHIVESIAKLPEAQQRRSQLQLLQTQQHLEQLERRQELVNQVAVHTLSGNIVGQFCASPAFAITLGCLSQAPLGLVALPQSAEHMAKQRVVDILQEVQMLEHTIFSNPAFKNLADNVKEIIVKHLEEISAIVKKETAPNVNGSAGSYANFSCMQNRIRTLTFLPLHRIFKYFTTHESETLEEALSPSLPFFRETLALAIMKPSKDDIQGLLDTGNYALAFINALESPKANRWWLKNCADLLIERLHHRYDLESFDTQLHVLMLVLGHITDSGVLETIITRSLHYESDFLGQDIFAILRDLPNEDFRKRGLLYFLLSHKPVDCDSRAGSFLIALDSLPEQHKEIDRVIEKMSDMAIALNVDTILVMINKLTPSLSQETLKLQLCEKLCQFKYPKQALHVLANIQMPKSSRLGIVAILSMFDNNREAALEYIETHMTDPEEKQRLLALFF